MRILLAGCNHKTAPLAVRERIAFDAPAAQGALAALLARFPAAEALLLSTCNRVELYVARPVHGHPQPDEMVAFIADRRGVPPDELAPLFYHHRDRDAVEHLMRVASSVDSMVLGETQILGQVRSAMELARGAGAVGPVLDRLAQSALASAKRVHAETGLSSGRVSVASVAVQFAQQIFSQFADKTVLTLGAGKMGRQTLERLVELGPREVLVANRDRRRAEDLAARFNGRVVEFSRLADALARADIVVSSTGSSQPLIDRALAAGVMKARRYRPLFLIDIAVPRDVDPAVGRIEQVYLYNIDDLQRVVESNLDGRAGRLAEVLPLLARHADQFISWLRARSLGPTIAALRRRLEGLRDEELAWLRPKLTGHLDRDRELIEQFAHRLVNKLLHDPASQLARAADPDAPPLDVYAHALAMLFNLNLDRED